MSRVVLKIYIKGKENQDCPHQHTRGLIDDRADIDGNSVPAQIIYALLCSIPASSSSFYQNFIVCAWPSWVSFPFCAL